MTPTPCAVRSCGLCLAGHCTAREDQIVPHSLACPSLVHMPDYAAVALLRGAHKENCSHARR